MSGLITHLKVILGSTFMIFFGALILLVQVDRHLLSGYIFPNASEEGLREASTLLLAAVAFGWAMFLSGRVDLLEKER